MLRPGLISRFGGVVSAVTSFLFQESSDRVLLESGDDLLLEDG